MMLRSTCHGYTRHQLDTLAALEALLLERAELDVDIAEIERLRDEAKGVERG